MNLSVYPFRDQRRTPSDRVYFNKHQIWCSTFSVFLDIYTLFLTWPENVDHQILWASRLTWLSFVLALIAMMHFAVMQGGGGHRVRCVKEEIGVFLSGLMSVIIMKYQETYRCRSGGRRGRHSVRISGLWGVVPQPPTQIQSSNSMSQLKDGICSDCCHCNNHGSVQEGVRGVITL